MCVHAELNFFAKISLRLSVDSKKCHHLIIRYVFVLLTLDFVVERAQYLFRIEYRMLTSHTTHPFYHFINNSDKQWKWLFRWHFVPV